MKLTRKSIAQVIETLIDSGARRSTVFLGPDLVVSATRVMWKGKHGKRRTDRRERRVYISLSYGCPNYAERQRIKQRKRAGTKIFRQPPVLSFTR